MTRFLCTILFLSAFGLSLLAQAPPAPATDKGSYKKNFTEGNLNLYDFEYMEALKYFLFAYKYDSVNANINYKIGQCYLHHPTQKHLAERYLEKAVQNVSKKYLDDEAGEKQASVMAYFFLGQSYHLDGRLDEATKMYDTYESFLSGKKKLDKEDRDFVDHFKKQVQNARQMMGAPLSIKITNLGDSINTEYPEYSPVITADEQVLYYTTRRPTTTGGEKSLDDGMYYEDIVVSYKDLNGKWSKPVSISPYINTSSNEATINLTPDGQTLIIYRGDVGNGDLYYSSFDGKDWSIPQRFGSNINTEFWETHASMSRDGSTLYFVSDRPGGLGGRDIYKCVKLPNGQWSLAQNVGPPINTPFDEDAPFLGADGITFYFASSGDKSMGGFDVMFSIIDENGKFSEPFNMGYPINTTDDDVFYVATPDNKRFYLSSAHEEIGKGGVHEKGFGEKDIYMGSVDLVKENPLALFRGRFVPGPCDSLPDDITIMVSSVTTGEIVGTYRPNRRNGTFSVIIPPGSKYNFTYQQGGIDLSSEEVFVPADISYEEIQKAINLKPLKICPGMLLKEDTVVKKLSLNVLVLNNKKDKKPIGKAEVKLHYKGAVDLVTTSGDNGRADGIKLTAEKSYEIIATANGKNSVPVIFNTIGVNENKVFEKTVYLEKTAEEDLTFLLNVTVLNNKALRKPVAGSKIKIKGTDGSTHELVTDEKGKASGIVLSPLTNYEIDVEKDGNVVTRGLISTNGIRKSKTFDKVLFATGGASEVPDNSVMSGNCFSFFFKYNMNEVDESAPEYKQFIDKLMEIKNAGGKINLNVQASASSVPTRKFKNNEDLAKVRGNGTIEKLKVSLKQRGVAESDIIFSSNKAFVSGPAYQGDPQNTERYGKFQYVKVCLIN
ncbi:MAG TPA: hypothetical protein VNY73_11190 [Bacteroidia bacterium]|nr:hypothetical protein [Bacteroidia bacterium]